MPQETYTFEQLTVATTAIGFPTENLREGTNSTREVILQVQGAQLRYRTDGTNPTSTVGIILNVGDRLVLVDRADIVNFRAIRTGSTSAVLNISYKR